MSSESPPPPPPQSAPAAAPEPTHFTRIRLAAVEDIPHMHNLIHQLAVFENLTHQFAATTATLSATLFPQNSPPPFTSTTTFILELSPSPFPPSSPNPYFTPIIQPLHLDSPIHDLQNDTFQTTKGDHTVATICGFVLFFPNYSTYLAKPGFYIQNIYVRECFRRKGMGKMLLAAVAAQAAEMGYARVEWIVAEWNFAAVEFYEQMGAEILPGKILCRLTGDALHNYAHANRRL